MGRKSSKFTYKRSKVVEMYKRVEFSEYTLEPDMRLLKEILSLQGESGAEDSVIDWLIEYCQGKGYLVLADEKRCLYVTKDEGTLKEGEDHPGFVCGVSHTDQVHEVVSNYHIIHHGDWVYAMDFDEGSQVGTGADDLLGVFIILSLMEKYPRMKAFFPVEEEIGCKGSNQAFLPFFEDCNWLFQPDRNMINGVKDFIISTNGVVVASNKMREDFAPTMSTFKYTEGAGTLTDVGALGIAGVKVASFNISCYLRCHLSDEVVYLPLLRDVMSFLDRVIGYYGTTRYEWHYPSKFTYAPPKKVSKATNVDWEDDEIVGTCYYCKSIFYNTDEYHEEVATKWRGYPVKTCADCHQWYKEITY